MEDQAIYEVTTPSPISDDTLMSLAEQAERRIDAMNKIKKVAIKLTNRHDWTDQGGKPYLQVSGAEKIARMFGISWRNSEPLKDIMEGGHFSFTYKGFFGLAGATIEAIGTRSSKDGFFKRYAYDSGEKVELPASEIDAGDVKKAAYTNCIGNGITRLLGIRNMTYEDLAEFAQITKEQIMSVGYKKDGKAKKGIVNEDSQKVTVGIKDVRKKAGKTKAGKDFVKYTIIGGDDNEYGTFSESTALLAKGAMESGLNCDIVFNQTQYGRDIEELTPVGPPKEGEQE